ncbi:MULTISPECIES: ABC transporter ATP-binding protein [Caproicibacterium]|jgi:ATP-binding cassette subfamily B multidrug efflux pump|uniref:ATP-binding cassette domain-containing protein n=1 Tax=Caproicibacterium lactatifermentans TaxID=2666138 RepID=A0ABX6PUE2_9FIRM|nr:ABC transporter ATP-binding protein [Caproicibacterium lactatifermentans]QKO29855.1 ATP-binding cassette domain-containing protein [Caproicibacterium lactatifermentans]
MNTEKPSRPQRHHGPMGGPPVGVPGEKANDFFGTLKKLAHYLGRYKLQILLVLLFAVCSAAFMIVGPKVLGKATTEVFTGLMNQISGTGQGINFTRIGQILLFLLALYLVSSAFNYAQGWIMTGVTMNVTYQLRRDIAGKIQRLPFSYYDTTTNGEVLSRLTNDVDTISQSLNQSMTQIITSVTQLIGILIMMFSINWQMSLVALCIIPLSGLVILFVVKHSQKYFKQQQDYLGHVNGHIEEMYGSHVVVQAFNGQERNEKTFSGYNENLYHSAWKSQFFSSLLQPIMIFIGNVGFVVVCILGGWYAIKGFITVGDIQAFTQYVRQFTQPIQQVANISNVMQSTAAAAERVFDFLEEKEEPKDSPNAITLNITDKPDTELNVHIRGSVQFAHVSFGYTPQKTIIHDFCAQVEPGQRVAIVGPTGAGKTTMVKLLMRFYDVGSGAILVDGYDIRDFKRSNLRTLFGMVLQDTWLYNATIRENIRYGRQDATDEQVLTAAKCAQVDHFVRTLPGGYDMVLNEDASNVSQGQKQLLTIARAFLADPQILILDEATSSVDTRTEIMIQKAMGELMKGRTSFIIAHRLSTIRGADLILVMDHGDIVEQGTHTSLMAKGGFYAKLYNSQFTD